jgi:hypothetical protein
VQDYNYKGLIYRNVLLRFKGMWKIIYNKVTCFTCFAQSPEDIL